MTARTWVRSATAVFVKDMRTEWRSRVAVLSVGLFALCSLTMIGLSLAGTKATPEVAAGLLWVLTLFTAATGLGRVFVQEEERGTGIALRLSAPGTAVWSGKFAANGVLLTVLAALSTPLLLMILGVKVVNPTLLFCVGILGALGTAATFTTMAALVALSSAKGGLLAALSFPVLVPLFLAAVHGTKAALGVGNADGAFTAGAGDVQVLLSYTVISVTASLMLFDFVWGD
ncbi:MAG: heme exporter protein CcmB [Akkermansiaceae bacterium]|nr:heme exporter protein CcmB [Armatimonadota bacterium]